MNKPIESAHISFSGDPSVGIPPAHFVAGMFFDPACTDDPAGWLEEIRAGFTKLYETMEGEGARVLFDFEIEALKAKIFEEGG